MSLAELAEETDVPSAFLYKVLRDAGREGPDASRTAGKGGGYELRPTRPDTAASSTSSTRSTGSPFSTCV